MLVGRRSTDTSHQSRRCDLHICQVQQYLRFVSQLVFFQRFILLVVAISRKNTNVVLVQSFLYKIVQVFTEYFKDVEEESIRDNFVVIYELLDEMMDFVSLLTFSK